MSTSRTPIVKPSHRVTGGRRDRNRGAGWQHVFAAIDDITRLGFAPHLPRRKHRLLGFLDALIRFYASHGINIERVLTDSGTFSNAAGATAPCSSSGPTHTATGTKANAPPPSDPALDSYNRFRRRRALDGLTRSSASTTSLGRTTSAVSAVCVRQQHVQRSFDAQTRRGWRRSPERSACGAHAGAPKPGTSAELGYGGARPLAAGTSQSRGERREDCSFRRASAVSPPGARA
jgi:hypothetical protein